MKLRPASFRTGPRAQRGAVLYLALMLLILLALLGVVGMQVAGMQERMSSNYRAGSMAFQNAEGAARSAENAVEKIANRQAPGDSPVVVASEIDQRCDDGFDPSAWVQQTTLGAKPAIKVRQIQGCIQGEGALDMGKPLEAATPVYQITSYAADSNGEATSRSAIDTIFKL
ncbi:PilX N-terminal domain-containing pilus assembly protein [Stenotrophomonas sp. 24(2023)]|uniref:pilus assembly PilX family protein n=1 Tax=Stenotrophomonas sp. 24(2023) TaxID=3068324 RepID=UPI0027E054EF|nr:PilX N-terminal domain-containing pilus assembly protein [Stenotrophomonas sp. 24(2023)]WMJ68606.1 PilX N-terminal domain-containing pilus assembly protein [Stenotrophomonas sp. 24(2023)]